MIDRTFTDFGKGIYAGRCQDRWHHVQQFVTKYADFIFTARSFEVRPITARDVQQSFEHAKSSATGPHQWSTKLVALARTEAHWWLAQMYNRLEHGAKWPSS
eukprot:7265638-Alexandrium_andersonii.AAC.1